MLRDLKALFNTWVYTDEMEPVHSFTARWRKLQALIAAFAENRRGAVAAFLAAAIIPLVGALGLATDTARGYMVKAKLGEALDAAALAGGRNIFSANRDADINMYFDANFPEGFMDADLSGPVIEVNEDQTVLRLTATATIPTTFMRVFGYNTMTIAAETEVTRSVDMLDLVLSIDMSGSMGTPMTKIAAARTAALDLVGILYGTNTVSPTFTVDGTTYNLLNIGLVPWNAKVNIKTEDWAAETPPTYNTALNTTQTVSAFTGGALTSFTNPVTLATGQTLIYDTNISEVPLLKAPASGWKGCVYARYNGDTGTGSNANDADIYRGPTTVGGKQWLAWYPIDPLEGEPVSGSYSSSGNGSGWNNTNKNCYGAYWNDQKNDPDKPAGTSFPIPNQPSWWRRAAPTIDTAQSEECTPCLSHGITPLTHDRDTIEDAINALITPSGNTNIPQGLAWAWEVLMPGVPFDQAIVDVPFPRQRAIVLLTDGQIVGGNGDAYMGRFSDGENAGTTTNSAHGFLPSPPDLANTRNNLNNRLKRLAANVKAEGIALYVIQFEEDNPNLGTLLQAVATEPNAPYYYFAPTATELQEAFQAVAANLSKLRISK